LNSPCSPQVTSPGKNETGQKAFEITGMLKIATIITIRNILVAFLKAITSFPPFINLRKHFSIKAKFPVTSPQCQTVDRNTKILHLFEIVGKYGLHSDKSAENGCFKTI
jgi:hypothetical protein